MSEHTTERITLARLPSGVRIETTLHTYGNGDGPTVYVQAAQHGREVSGAAVLRRLHERMAARLWSLASEADAILDLHTASRDSLTHVVFREDDPEARRPAETFGTDLLLAELADDGLLDRRWE